MVKRMMGTVLAATLALLGSTIGGAAAAEAPYAGSGGDLASMKDSPLEPGTFTTTRSGALQRTVTSTSPWTISLASLGMSGQPAASVVLDVTAGRTTSSGTLTSRGRPLLNLSSAAAQRSQVTVPVQSGTVQLSTNRSSALRVVPVGWYRSGTVDTAGGSALMTPWTPLASTALAAGATRTLTVAGTRGTPKASGAALVTVTISSRSAGDMRLFAHGSTSPRTAIRYAAGRTVRQVRVPLSDAGRLSLHPSTAATASLRVEGYVLRGLPGSAGATELLQTPATLFDTRTGTGIPKAVLPAGTTRDVTLSGRAGLPTHTLRSLVLTVDTTATKAGSLSLWPTGTTSPGSVIALPEGRAVTQVIVPATTTRLAVRSSVPTHITATATGYVISKDRSAVRAVPRSTTRTPTTAQVLSVTYRADGTSRTRLAAGAVPPKVGGHLVAKASAVAPNGLLGRVTAVARAADGSYSVTTVRAPLSDAYSTYQVTSRRLTTPTATAAATRTSGEPATSRAIAGFECRTAEGTLQPQVDVQIDPGAIRSDFTLDANVVEPYLNMYLTVRPTVTLTASLPAGVTCEREMPVMARIPVSSGPPLELILQPRVTIDASGEVSATLTWKTSAMVGIHATKQRQSLTHGFGSDVSVSARGEATVNAATNIRASLAVAGLDLIDPVSDENPRVAVDLDVGPQLNLSVASDDCSTLSTYLRATLSAEADLLVKDWSWAGKSVQTTPKQLWSTCKAWTGLVVNRSSYSFRWTGVNGPPWGLEQSAVLSWQRTAERDVTQGTSIIRSRGWGENQNCLTTITAPSGTRGDAHHGISMQFPAGEPAPSSVNATQVIDDNGLGFCSNPGTSTVSLLPGTPQGYDSQLVNEELMARYPTRVHTIDTTVTGSIDEICARFFSGCDFQKPAWAETRTGQVYYRIRMTDRPDMDADGIPDAVDARPTVLDAIS
jgi:hypothetical protein